MNGMFLREKAVKVGLHGKMCALIQKKGCEQTNEDKDTYPLTHDKFGKLFQCLYLLYWAVFTDGMVEEHS